MRAAPSCHCHQSRGTSFGPVRRATTTLVPPAPAQVQQAVARRGPFQAPARALAERRDTLTCVSRSGQEQKQRGQQRRRWGRVAGRRGPRRVHELSARVTSQERGVASPGLLSNRETRGDGAQSPLRTTSSPCRESARGWLSGFQFPAHRLQGVIEVIADMSCFIPEEEAGRVK